MYMDVVGWLSQLSHVQSLSKLPLKTFINSLRQISRAPATQKGKKWTTAPFPAVHRHLVISLGMSGFKRVALIHLLQIASQLGTGIVVDHDLKGDLGKTGVLVQR